MKAIVIAALVFTAAWIALPILYNIGFLLYFIQSETLDEREETPPEEFPSPKRTYTARVKIDSTPITDCVLKAEIVEHRTSGKDLVRKIPGTQKECFSEVKWLDEKTVKINQLTIDASTGLILRSR